MPSKTPLYRSPEGTALSVKPPEKIQLKHRRALKGRARRKLPKASPLAVSPPLKKDTRRLCTSGSPDTEPTQQQPATAHSTPPLHTQPHSGPGANQNHHQQCSKNQPQATTDSTDFRTQIRHGSRHGPPIDINSLLVNSYVVEHARVHG